MTSSKYSKVNWRRGTILRKMAWLPSFSSVFTNQFIFYAAIHNFEYWLVAFFGIMFQLFAPWIRRTSQYSGTENVDAHIIEISVNERIDPSFLEHHTLPARLPLSTNRNHWEWTSWRRFHARIWIGSRRNYIFITSRAHPRFQFQHSGVGAWMRSRNKELGFGSQHPGFGCGFWSSWWGFRYVASE